MAVEADFRLLELSLKLEDMKKLISIIVLLLLCIAGSAAEAYLVNTKTLNMRAKPQSGAKKLGSLRQGEVLQVDT